MLVIKATLPTKNLPVRRVLAKLFQSFVYHCLDDKEHEGYKHPNGKVFKAMNFKIFYKDYDLEIKYSALDKENEKKVATTILKDGLKLGEIHIASVEIALENRQKSLPKSITVGGFISAAIKDGNSSKKIYLEPKTHKFMEIIYNNTLQKYEALFGKIYERELKIELVKQKPKERLFFYHKAPIKSWYGVYKVEADEEMLGMILDTGIGGNVMQGLGYCDIISIKEFYND
ncbi:MAG: hypothetical protein K0U47_11160 [Epsilonproteobacteria bacterium]|nr:hypothetical protein [Campylobacterota bacterium]